MRLQNITIKNFKAIKEASLDLGHFNVLVGTNGSGKSSVLQAMHWMFQSGRSHSIKANAEGKASTLSEKNATFMPSPDYRNAGNGQEYGNKKDSPQLDVSITALTSDEEPAKAEMWIKAARNEGLSVHIPSGNPIVTAMRDPSREFSAYIPGLAGIPLSEARHSKLIVRRLAAAGDANTVLRNILLLLKDTNVDKHDGLTEVQNLVSRVMGKISLDIIFNEDNHAEIQAKFQTEEMEKLEPQRFKPLEIAGIGFLQVIQIFAYLVYFRPVVLLVDEPDSHLHPTAQEKLVKVLADTARRFDTQVLVTTHSPSVVRTLPPETKVIWMKEGEVQRDGDTRGRQLMGWGLLDRRALLLTEDKDASMLQSLLAQWPDLDRQIAVWPFHGSDKLPEPEVLTGLTKLTGDSLKVILHRDRDFLMPDEIERITEPYQKAHHKLWFTRCSDVEAYWAEPNVISAYFDISHEDAVNLLEESEISESRDDAHLRKLRNKRTNTINKINKKGEFPIFGENDVINEACKYGKQHKILGKDLVSAIRKAAQDRGLNNTGHFGKTVPNGLVGHMARDLREEIQQFLD